ncbi:type VII secretion protein EccB [Kitasatospora sp. NA04385]|uniref:type VII secretion protein EccB n=1 Tax=Kitasatospora sp. NA04385 TaxID=2742135 RepID=UPI001591F5BD|nr:type VII secretion protein EccB [Kitasatospora sp. NA04385]QKW21816.1 type VII secretion protein EccB [Kitasatospora sp. NA04385]
MASRRDELNAYTFARKRMVGAFLQPGGGGNDEDAPRPLRAVLPSFVVAAVVVAGFGMWGVLKPAAPPNWDSGKFVIQGKSSTTRYVILNDGPNKEPTLHQVLNMSSARLVLPENATVQTVADDVLDKYPRRGATIGIPYAPDKLPAKGDAGDAKTWSVCDKMGKDNLQATVGQSVFIAAGPDKKTLAAPDKVLNDNQMLLVQEPPVNSGNDEGSIYLVDSKGVKHALGKRDMADKDRKDLLMALSGPDVKPQQVTKEWLDTLANGDLVEFPRIDTFRTTRKSGPSKLGLSNPDQNRIGRLLTFQGAYYAVGENKLYQITEFQAQLMRTDPLMQDAYPDGGAPTIDEVGAADISKLATKTVKDMMSASKDLPVYKQQAVNVGEKATRSVVCSTFEGVDDKGGIKRSVWAHTDYPAQVTSGSVSAHVTPGHGLLYRAVEGDTLGTDSQAASSGSDFLITDSGLRYSLPANSDGGAAGTATASPEPGKTNSTNEAQARLGYKDVLPPRVPLVWSKLVPAGPVLNTNSALQAQNA